MTDTLLYQGFQRSVMLRYLHRLCIQRYRDALLDSICARCVDGVATDELAALVGNWCKTIVEELDRVIREAIRQNPGNPRNYRPPLHHHPTIL